MVKIFLILFVVILPFVLPSGSVDSFLKDAKNFPTRTYYYDVLEEETLKAEPLDFLFLGGSSLQNAVLPNIIENHIHATSSEKNFTAFNANLGGGATDAFTAYVLLQNFIEHRKIRVAFLATELFHMRVSSPTVINFNRSLLYPALRHMPFEEILQFAGVAIAYGPLRLKNIIFPTQRSNTLVALYRNEEYRNLRGGVLFYESYGKVKDMEIKPIMPPHLTAAEVIHNPSPENSAHRSAFSNYFIQKIISLCKENDIKLYLFMSPSLQGHFSAQSFGDLGVETLEAPLDDLFPNKSPDEVKYFFRDDSHLNAVGGRYFTETLLPTFVKIHKETSL